MELEGLICLLLALLAAAVEQEADVAKPPQQPDSRRRPIFSSGRQYPSEDVQFYHFPRLTIPDRVDNVFHHHIPLRNGANEHLPNSEELRTALSGSPGDHNLHLLPPARPQRRRSSPSSNARETEESFGRNPAAVRTTNPFSPPNDAFLKVRERIQSSLPNGVVPGDREFRSFGPRVYISPVRGSRNPYSQRQTQSEIFPSDTVTTANLPGANGLRIGFPAGSNEFSNIGATPNNLFPQYGTTADNPFLLGGGGASSPQFLTPNQGGTNPFLSTGQGANVFGSNGQAIANPFLNADSGVSNPFPVQPGQVAGNTFSNGGQFPNGQGQNPFLTDSRLPNLRTDGRVPFPPQTLPPSIVDSAQQPAIPLQILPPGANTLSVPQTSNAQLPNGFDNFDYILSDPFFRSQFVVTPRSQTNQSLPTNSSIDSPLTATVEYFDQVARPDRPDSAGSPTPSSGANFGPPPLLNFNFPPGQPINPINGQGFRFNAFPNGPAFGTRLGNGSSTNTTNFPPPLLPPPPPNYFPRVPPGNTRLPQPSLQGASENGTNIGRQDIFPQYQGPPGSFPPIQQTGVISSPQGAQRTTFSPPYFPQGQRQGNDFPSNFPAFRGPPGIGVGPQVERSPQTVPSCAAKTNSTFCFEDPEYPVNVVRYALQTEQFLLERLLATPVSQSPNVNFVEGISDNEGLDAQKAANFTETYICSANVKYGSPLRAANTDGYWKIVVNLQHYQGPARYSQDVRIEQCTNQGGPCNHMIERVESQCVQKFNVHRLLTWTYEKGLHFDHFRLPVACSCYIREQPTK